MVPGHLHALSLDGHSQPRDCHNVPFDHARFHTTPANQLDMDNRTITVGREVHGADQFVSKQAQSHLQTKKEMLHI